MSFYHGALNIIDMDNHKEIWKDIVGYEGQYQVSNMGRVRGLNRFKINGLCAKFFPGKVLSANPKSNDEYPKVILNGKSLKVHALVLKTFVPDQPEAHICCHKDGVKRNNKLENLYWGSFTDNIKDAERHGTAARCHKHWKAKLTKQAVEQIRSLKGLMHPIEIGKLFDIYPSYVKFLHKGKGWDMIDSPAYFGDIEP